MHRLSGPKLFIFIPIVIIGIVCVTLTPTYFNVTRILSLSALIIGEAGLSFIPVLAFYPKAKPIQAVILAVVYFFTTLIICFSVWGVNSFSIPSEFAFLVKDGEFYINIYALFAANLVSLITLLLNFRLVYDEELSKDTQNKNQSKYRDKQSFVNFQSSAPRHPDFDDSRLSERAKPKSFNEPGLEDDLLKPFEFEPQLEFSEANLPEESSGKLFYSDTPEKSPDAGIKDFEKEDSVQIEPEKPKKTVSPFPPQNIKEDLQAIFEQYSSLNAVKKLTSGITDKPHLKKKEYEKKPMLRKPYTLPKGQISVEIKDEDVHEASFRDLTEADKLNEIKEELKKELKAEIQAKLIEESQKKEELKKETEEVFAKETVIEEIQDQKENIAPIQTQDVGQIKEDLIQSIKDIKDELIESLKKEIKKELIEENSNELTVQKEDIEDTTEYVEKLNFINNEPKISGSMFLSHNGAVIAESWKEKPVLHKSEHASISNEFNFLSKQISKTNQGGIYHILLESDNGTLILANSENKILTVYSKGTGEANSGQILRTLIESEEN